MPDKKKKTAIIIGAAAVVIVLAIVAIIVLPTILSNNTTTPQEKPKPETLSGKYTIISIEGLAESDISTIFGGHESDFYIDFQDDSKCVMSKVTFDENSNYGQATFDCTYTNNKITAIIGEETLEMPYTFEKGRLTVTENGQNIIYKK